MKNITSFEEIYEEIRIKNELQLNELYIEAKKESKKRNRIALAVCIIIDIIGILIVLMNIKNNNINMQIIEDDFMMCFPIIFPVLFMNIIFYLVISLFFTKRIKEYSKKFKELVIKDLLLYFYEDLVYMPGEGLNNQVYNDVKYNEYYNRYASDDYIKAKLDNKYDVEMAEILTQKVETHTDSKGRSHTTTTTIFSGLFAKIKIDKSIKTKLKIKQNLSFSNSKRLNMDSQEFEKHFDVSSENKIIGMQILTSDVMEKLVQFYKSSGIKYDIIIDNDIIYLRFHCGRMFETGGLKKGAIPKETLNKYYNILRFIYGLTTDIIKTIHDVEI